LDDGTILEGQWENNFFVKGTVSRPGEVDYRFEGKLLYQLWAFRDIEIVGAGTAFLPDQSKYVGSINKYGHFHGQGTMFYSDGRSEKGFWQKSRFSTFTSTDRDYYQEPLQLNDGWEVSHAAEEGMDVKKLAEMKNRILQSVYENIHSVVIIKNGKLVLEEYLGTYHQGRKHNVYSVTKSIGSLLTGIAIDKGFISDVNEKIYPYFSEYEPEEGWDSKMKEVTIKHLLNMTSGLACEDRAQNLYTCKRDLFRASDWVKFILDKGVIHQPGEHYSYNTPSLILLGKIISEASNMELPDFADKYLLTPLGISDVHWWVKPNVVPLGNNLHMRPRDMAKIGYLYLNDGQWKGKQIVSKNWIKESTIRNYEEGPGWDRYGIRHQYQWWSFTDDFNFPKVEGYYASGNGGQYILIFPSLDLVVATTAGNHESPKDDHPVWMVTDYILPSLEFISQNGEIEPLDSQQLRTELEHHTFYKYKRYNIYLAPNGIMNGAIPTGESDVGRWYITSSGVYCQKWNEWGNGRENCARVYQRGDLFQFRGINRKFRITNERKKGNPEGY